MSGFQRSSMSINSMLGTTPSDTQQRPPANPEPRPSSVPVQQAVPNPVALRRSPHMPTFRASSQPPGQAMHEPPRFFQHPGGPPQQPHQHEPVFNHHQHLPHLSQHHIPQQPPQHPPPPPPPRQVDHRLPPGLPSHANNIYHPQPGHFQLQQSNMPPREYRPPLLVDRERERDQREREVEQDREREREQRIIREREEQRTRELQERDRLKAEQQQRLQHQHNTQQQQPANAQSQRQPSATQGGPAKAPTERVRNKDAAPRHRNRTTQGTDHNKRTDRSPPPVGPTQKAARNDYRTASVRSNSPGAPAAQPSSRRHLLLNALNTLSTDFARQKDQYFNHQLRQLQEDLSRLHNGTHLHFNAEIADLQDIRNETLFIAREEGLSRLEEADQDYKREIAAAKEEYEMTRTTLREELLVHLQSKKRRLETDQSLTDISLQATVNIAGSDAPPSPSLSGAPRKLRHRMPAPVVGSRYPSTALITKTALDGVLESIGETVRARKGMGGIGAEDRVRDRIEREREKLVRTMLEGCRPQEAEDDLALLRRKYVPKKTSLSTAPMNGVASVPAKRKASS